MSEWVAVEDRLPIESCEVLAYFDTLGCKAMAVVYYSAHTETFKSLECEEPLNTPLHWMPLPNEPLIA